MCLFQAQNGPLVLKKKNYLVQTIIITLIWLLPVFIVQNFKKFLQWIQSYEDAQFWAPKWPICPNDNFFRKTVNEPCFFHSCLSRCQKSKSDINLLVKYWRLRILKSQWPKAIFGYNLRIRFFQGSKKYILPKFTEMEQNWIIFSPS